MKYFKSVAIDKIKNYGPKAFHMDELLVGCPPSLWKKFYSRGSEKYISVQFK